MTAVHHRVQATDDELEDLAYVITAMRFKERGLRGVIGEPDIAIARPLAAFLIGEGYRRQGPIPTIIEYAEILDAVRARQIAKGYTPEHDDEHGIRHLLNWAIDYARRRRPDDSAGMIRAALELLDRQGPIAGEWEYVWEEDEEVRATLSPRGPRVLFDDQPYTPEQLTAFPKGRRVRRRKAGQWEPADATENSGR